MVDLVYFDVLVWMIGGGFNIFLSLLIFSLMNLFIIVFIKIVILVLNFMDLFWLVFLIMELIGVLFI